MIPSLPVPLASFDLPDLPPGVPAGAVRDVIPLDVVGPRPRKQRAKTRPNRCAACGMEGHNKRSPKCSARSARVSRAVLYMAHPLGGDVRANVARAMRWLTWLRRTFRDVTIIAPWIAAVLAGEDDNDPAQREAGLVDCDAVIPLLHGFVLVGGRVSSGMAREATTAARADVPVVDLTALGEEPPVPTVEPSMANRALLDSHIAMAAVRLATESP